jgi:hypothetical protein
MDHQTTHDSLQHLTHKVVVGQAAEQQRAHVIRKARLEDPEYWTQTRLADAAGISQAAVSKLLRATPYESSEVSKLDDTPGYLIGRLLGIAAWAEQQIYDQREKPASWERLTDKVFEGRMPPTAMVLQQIKHMVLSGIDSLPEEKQVAIRSAYASLEGTVPIGQTNLSQTEQMRMVLGYDSQRHGLWTST